jgi:uncharacterized membrane protein YdjX (TVP38/TMEM64 family)
VISVKSSLTVIIAAAVLVLGVALAIWSFAGEQILFFFRDPAALRAEVQGYGFWGPVVIAGLRAAACFAGFVPSSPVALAAGAAYGPVWGSIYVLLGAELGALSAFLIARLTGREYVERRGWLSAVGATRIGGWLLRAENSQARLSMAVIGCRLLPGLNLDAVSYVAGITPLRWWRFLLANLAGLLPYTVLLIVLGDRLVRWDWTGVAIGLALLAALVLITFGFGAIRRRSAGECER